MRPLPFMSRSWPSEMVTSLKGLTMRKRMTAYLACVGGCLDYLGIEVSDGWLWGGTGHAFVINLHPELCPSGPTAWNSSMLFELAPNLGYAVEGVFGRRQAGDAAFAEAQRRAWEHCRAAIDRGVPCFGWELWPNVPDYFVITGYDEVGYYYGGYVTGGPTPWNELGTHDVQMVEVYAVAPSKSASDAVVVRDGLAAAIDLVENPGDRIFEGYLTGPAAFEAWAHALATGEAAYDGNVYNNQVWGECRELAVELLREARQRLAPASDSALARAFDAAEAAYAEVRDALSDLLAMHPPREQADWVAKLTSTEGAALMRAAAEAEARGMVALKEIVAAL